MGQVAGYTVADYLIQYAAQERRYKRLPASIWDALVSHVQDPGDAARLADSAEGRLLYRYAIPLYRRAAAVGDRTAAARLARLLGERGDLDGLRARAAVGDRDAAARLADLLERRGNLDGAAQVLRARADAGDRFSASRLATLLERHGDLDGLRVLADAGARIAELIADLLINQGRSEEASGLRRFGLNPDGTVSSV